MRILIENTIYNIIRVEKSVCSPILYITIPLLLPNKYRIYTIEFRNDYYMTDAFYNLLNKGYFNTEHHSVKEISFQDI